MSEGERRQEQGGQGEQGRGEKGRLIQDRDRLGLAIVGVNRVVREKSLQAVLFPGRDEATFGNRVWELARELQPVGAYWKVQRRTREDGSVERYLSLTDVGYRQAEVVLGGRRFPRRPVEDLRPSHVLHDLELADLALSLLPRRTEEYQPKVRGKLAGLPIQVEAVHLPRKWRWYHASVFRRLTVLSMPRDESGRVAGRPKVELAYEPDAILELDTYGCARFFIEYDRGTEPIAGAKERRTIADKLERIWKYFWVPRGNEPPGGHWSLRRSYHMKAFAGAEVRAPKNLFITTSAKRRENIWRLAVEFFADRFTDKALGEFLAVLTVDDARQLLRRVTANAETCEEPREMPWVAEVRSVAQAEAAKKARAEGLARAARVAAAAEEAKDLHEAEAAQAGGKRVTFEEIEERRCRDDEAWRRSQQGMMGRLRDLVVGKPG